MYPFIHIRCVYGTVLPIELIEIFYRNLLKLKSILTKLNTDKIDAFSSVAAERIVVVFAFVDVDTNAGSDFES
jgi:hypothetical protein